MSAIENINEKLSGFWLVTGINYLYRRTGVVSQEITLVRRDLTVKYTDKNDIRKLDNVKATETTPKLTEPTSIPSNTKSVGIGSNERSVYTGP